MNAELGLGLFLAHTPIIGVDIWEHVRIKHLILADELNTVYRHSTSRQVFQFTVHSA